MSAWPFSCSCLGHARCTGEAAAQETARGQRIPEHHWGYSAGAARGMPKPDFGRIINLLRRKPVELRRICFRHWLLFQRLQVIGHLRETVMSRTTPRSSSPWTFSPLQEYRPWKQRVASKYGYETQSAKIGDQQNGFAEDGTQGGSIGRRHPFRIQDAKTQRIRTETDGFEITLQRMRTADGAKQVLSARRVRKNVRRL